MKLVSHCCLKLIDCLAVREYFVTTNTMSTTTQVCGRSCSCSCLCLSALRTERMKLIHSLQMDRFYGSNDSTSTISGCFCYTCLWRHVNGQSLGSKYKARPAQVTMQICTLWQPVRKARLWILCQALLFASWLPMAAVAGPHFPGLQRFMAHGTWFA